MKAIDADYNDSSPGQINLPDLRYLLSTAEHGHFGRAAEACAISQPTLSVQVGKFGELLGVALFGRTSKTVAPDTSRLTR